jgi:hypothetical protein
MTEDLLPIMQRLQPLRELGYIFCGVRLEGAELIITLIHKSWDKYDLRRQFGMAWDDVPHDLKSNGMVLELPTLEMFEEKFADRPHDSIVVFDGRVSH